MSEAFKNRKIVASIVDPRGIYRTNAGFDYINGVPAGLERDVRIYCDWFVVDATASAAWRAAHDAAEDARLAALPGAQRVEQVLAREYLCRSVPTSREALGERMGGQVCRPSFLPGSSGRKSM
jgi:hypothetical protein